MAKGHYQVRKASGSQHAADFVHYSLRRDDMLEDGIALDTSEYTATKRQVMGVGLNINAGHASDVEVDVAGDMAAGAAEVEIEASERGVYVVLSRIGDERGGWLKQ